MNSADKYKAAKAEITAIYHENKGRYGYRRIMAELHKRNFLLKTKNGYADEAVKLLGDSFTQTVSYIRQYPFGTAKVLGARLYQIGDYVIYVIAGASYDGEDAEAKLADSEYAKIDEAIRGVFGRLPENLAVVPEESGSTGGLIAPEDDMPVLGG